RPLPDNGGAVSYAEAIPDVFNPRGSCLYHYTRLSAALESILPHGSLRMSPFAAMRDPRESKLLEIIGIPAEFVPDDWDWREEITKFTRWTYGRPRLECKAAAPTFDALSGLPGARSRCPRRCCAGTA